MPDLGFEWVKQPQALSFEWVTPDAGDLSQAVNMVKDSLGPQIGDSNDVLAGKIQANAAHALLQGPKAPLPDFNKLDAYLAGPGAHPPQTPEEASQRNMDFKAAMDAAGAIQRGANPVAPDPLTKFLDAFKEGGKVGAWEGMVPGMVTTIKGLAGAFFSNASTPDRIEAPKDSGLVTKGLAGTYNVAEQARASLTSPAALLTMGTLPLARAGARALIEGAWTLYMGLKAVPEASREVHDALESGDSQRIIESVENFGLAGTLTAFGAKRLTSPEAAIHLVNVTELEKEAGLPATQATLITPMLERLKQRIIPVQIPVKDQTGNIADMETRYFSEPEFRGYQQRTKVGQGEVSIAEQRLLESPQTMANAGEVGVAVRPAEPVTTSGHVSEVTTGAPETSTTTRVGSIIDYRPINRGQGNWVVVPVMEGAGGETFTGSAVREGIGDKATAAAEATRLRNRSGGLVADTSLEAWADRVLSQDPRGRTQAGLDPSEEARRIAAFTVKGVALLERGFKAYGPWASRMIAAHGEDVRPVLRAVYDESKKAYLGILANAKIYPTKQQRKLAARGMNSEAVSPAHQKEFRENPASYYDPQSPKSIQEALASQSLEELAAVKMISPDGPQNAWVAAQLEMYHRLKDSNPDKAWSIIENAMKMGTSFGQLVNQYKLLPGASPDGLVILINKRLAGNGFDALGPAEEVTFRDLARRAIESNIEVKLRERAWMQAPNETNFQAVDAAHKAATVTAKAFMERVRAYEPRRFWATLSSWLQGNLLVPISESVNLVANMSNMNPRQIARGGAAFLDMVDSFIRNKPRTQTVSPAGGLSAFTKGAIRSGPKVVQTLLYGLSDEELARRDVRSPMQPLRSLRDAILGQEIGPKVKGKWPISERLVALMQGAPILSWNPTVMLRALGAADLPFREGAKARIINTELKLMALNTSKAISDLQKLPSTPVIAAELNARRRTYSLIKSHKDWFLKYPQLIFEGDTLGRIQVEAMKAVYQQSNWLSNMVLRGATHEGFGGFLVKLVAPFVMTPSNVALELMSWLPISSEINLAIKASKRDWRGAREAATKVVVGSVIAGAGLYIYKRGLIAPTMDSPDVQHKARLLANSYFQPGHLNISGLKRLINGESGAWKAGDQTIDLARAGGITGAILLNVANTFNSFEKMPDEELKAMDVATKLLGRSVLANGSYLVNQSYLKNVSDILGALTEGPFKADQFMRAMFESVSSIAFPQNLGAITRATRDNKVEMRDDSLLATFNNVLKNRLGAVSGLVGERTDAGLPLKVGLFGEPLKETPRGRNPYAYQFLDVFKSTEIPADPLRAQLYGLWRRTGNDGVLPTPPDATFSSLGSDYRLNRRQLAELQTLVGERRRQMADSLIDDPGFMQTPDEGKIAILKLAWMTGELLGSTEFLAKHQGDLKSKPSPIGFQLMP